MMVAVQGLIIPILYHLFGRDWSLNAQEYGALKRSAKRKNTELKVCLRMQTAISPEATPHHQAKCLVGRTAYAVNRFPLR